MSQRKRVYHSGEAGNRHELFGRTTHDRIGGDLLGSGIRRLDSNQPGLPLAKRPGAGGTAGLAPGARPARSPGVRILRVPGQGHQKPSFLAQKGTFCAVFRCFHAVFQFSFNATLVPFGYGAEPSSVVP